jgi:methylglutaconyl-CoA hydratase
MIANLRVSDEGQEGMAAFLEKRKPAWARPDEEKD